MKIVNFCIIFLVIVLPTTLASCNTKKNNYQLVAPEGKLSLHIRLIDNKLNYQISQQGEEKIGLSVLEIMADAAVTIIDADEMESDSTWKPVWGQQSTIRDNYRQLQLNIDIEGVKGVFVARVYNEGVAFRFVLDEGEKPDAVTLKCGYAFSKQSNYYFPKGETEPLGPLHHKEINDFLQQKKNKISLPLVVESNESFMALLESDLYAASGISPMRLYAEDVEGEMVSVNRVKVDHKKWMSPWRVILFGDTAGELVVNTVPINLATPCQLENTDWIKPGKTLWDWRVHGYTAPDGFVYGIDNESYYRFIDFAAETGVDYFLIDDAWYKHVTKGHFELSDKLALQAVIDYAAKKDVQLMLYYDRRHGEYGDDALFPYYQSLGMKGIKYGFMGSKVGFTREAIQKSAASHLLIDFHDSPVPFTGIRRTYPNAITREYCHAQQDSRRAFTPETFIKMALINAITGPLDMNNGNFDLNGINAGLRQKGPRKPHSYLSTVCSEAARTLVIFSGLVCIPDAPEAYAAKADLFEFIQKMPVGRWDESHVLHAKIGEYISTARDMIGSGLLVVFIVKKEVHWIFTLISWKRDKIMKLPIMKIRKKLTVRLIQKLTECEKER
ncbi:retaining alpha-galactosidase precursor [Saccharicrinis fermentans DSM 9555 = JCM 21142]|uniref:Retaining alpha-galactosidase n=1 Tax=Saccharicrinis fermentans DSM 9555 = JCM 21142 TaxID=869213 RepID=W7XV34_9BACT|nr:glycoside hydrolase family 97 catalytic domain-containing protein [Saccharicrinis fermentans]GAF01930.1 retaining alpha-galactosidase precursor [Saccharicrinis fermentans DSM 9555 = JCM 21142]